MNDIIKEWTNWSHYLVKNTSSMREISIRDSIDKSYNFFPFAQRFKTKY